MFVCVNIKHSGSKKKRVTSCGTGRFLVGCNIIIGQTITTINYLVSLYNEY